MDVKITTKEDMDMTRLIDNIIWLAILAVAAFGILKVAYGIDSGAVTPSSVWAWLYGEGSWIADVKLMLSAI